MQQMDTYISWINRQLSEHPRGKVVTDLQKDMRDGIVFLQLVEVIGGVDQEITYDDVDKLSICDMRANINRVLEFLSNNNVRVHHIAPKEIMEGKLKPIMRLVLALAAHFKPNEPIDQSFPGVWKSRKKLERTSSLVSILSNAAASLVDASKYASSGNNFRCNNNKSNDKKSGLVDRFYSPNQLFSLPPRNSPISVDEPVKIMKLSDDMVPEISNRPVPKIPPCETVLASNNVNRNKTNPPSPLSKPSLDDRQLLISTPKRFNTQKQALTSTPKPKAGKLPPSYETHISAKRYMNVKNNDSLDDTNDEIVSQSDNKSVSTFTEEIHIKEKSVSYDTNELTIYHDEILDDISVTKTILSELHNLIASGQPHDESGIDSFQNDSFEEQLILRNLMLEQKDEECSLLKSELSELKELNIQWSGEKVALQTRLSQQEQVILALKFRLLQYEISSKNKNQEELDKTIKDHQKQMQAIRSELASKNDIIHKQEYQLTELNTELNSKTNLEASLQSKLEMQESKVCSLQKQLLEVTEQLHSNNFISKIRDEASMGIMTGKLNEAKFQREAQKILQEHRNMCVTISNIRKKFKNDDPINHAFDSMEHGITSLTDTLSILESTATHTKESHNRILSNVPKVCSSNLLLANSVCGSDSGFSSSTSNFSGERLKLIYYLGKSVTPILKSSDLRIGVFTLRDFKKAISRSGRYRYFFKAVDSDFGFVREELLHDKDIVPGHDNKIVAWIEPVSSSASIV